MDRHAIDFPVLKDRKRALGTSNRLGAAVVITVVLSALMFAWLFGVADYGWTETSPAETASDSTIYDLAITLSNTTYETEWPIEWWIKNSFTVTNNGSQALNVDFNATVLETSVEISPYPQPFHLYLSPGEQQRVMYMLDLAWAGLSDDDMLVEQDINRTVRFVFWTQGNTSDSRSLDIGHVIHVVPRSWLESNPNAVISGHVYGPTGRPIEGLRVDLLGPNLNYGALTDQAGHYEIPFHAHKRLMTNESLMYGLVVRQPGFEAFMKALSPVPGDSLTEEIHLAKSRETANLTLVSSTDTGMTVFRGAVSADERYVAFSQGHCELGLSQDDIKNRSSVLLFDVWTGQMLWQRFLGGEAWGVDITSDGSYIVTTVIQPAYPEYAILFDRDGNEVWNTTWMGAMGSREIRISHDGKRIAWGVGDGWLHLLNLSDGSVNWSTFLEGQIRQILFSADDSTIYAGSGDGYLYALDAATGDVIWRSNIEAWPFSTGGMTLSSDGSLIATASKMGNVSLVDTASRSTLWSFDTMGGGHFAEVSPNNDYVFAGSGGVFGAVMLGIDGSARWFEADSSAADVMSDGTHIAVGREQGLDIINPNGTVLGSYREDFSYIGNPVYSHFVYVTENGSRVVLGHGSGKVYFWDLSFEPIAGSEDSVAPVTVDDYDGLWHASDFYINLSATDDGAGVASTYYRVNGGPTMSVALDGQPLIHVEGADNTLEYWSVDNASNEEWPHHLLTGIKLDVTDPIADAGPDQSVPYGSVVELNGSLSSDNFGISGYLWTFTYDGSPVTLTGAVVDFTFDIPGTYVVTLTVVDLAGRTRSDVVTIDVQNVPIPEYQSVLVPALGAVCVLMLSRRLSRTSRRR